MEGTTHPHVHQIVNCATCYREGPTLVIQEEGLGLSKIRGDPITVALAHETRRGIVEVLQTKDEMSTVQIQEAIDVTRYHLYHHLKQLVAVGVVENHRDEGRARWWRITGAVALDSPAQSGGASMPAGLPDEVAELIRRGAEVHWLEVGGTARDSVAAKKMLEDAAADWNIELNLPFTFTPGGILIIGKPRN